MVSMGETRGKQWDNNITVTRALLLFSVIAAHSGITRVEASSAAWLLDIWQVLSVVGVPGFLILSGYLYKGMPEPFVRLCAKKSKSVLLPWAVCGTLVFFVTQFGAYSLLGYVKFMAGYGSYLYYMTVLWICFLLFYFVYDKTVVLVLAVALNCVSLALIQFGIYRSLFTDFLNVANWIGFFAVGCILRKYGLLDKLKASGKVWKALFIVGGAAAFACAVLLKVETYFHLAVIPLGCLSFIALYCLCSLVKAEKSTVLRNIGNWSFTVYLLHMPVVAVFKRIVRRIYPNLYVLIPLFTVALFLAVLTVMDKAGRKFGPVKKINALIGMR